MIGRKLPPWQQNLLALWIANFLTASGLMAILPFFPLFVRDLGVADARGQALWAGLIVGAAPFMAALMSGFWGAIGDQVGRRKMVLRALFAIALFVGAMAFATAPWHLLALRVAQGIFSGYVAPTMTLVSVLAPPEMQGRVGGSLQSSVLAGSVFGPLAGDLLTARFGFGAMSAICAASSLAAALIVRVYVIEPPRAARAPGSGAAALLTSTVQTAARDLVRALRSADLRPLFAALFVVRLATSAVNPTLVLHVEALAGGASDASARLGARVFSAQPLALFLFTPLWGLLVARAGTLRTIVACAIGGGALTLAQAAVATPLALGALRFAAGAVLAGIFPAAFAWTAAKSDAARRGGTFGLTFAALSFGIAFGPWIGSGVDALFGYRTLLVGSGLLLLAAAAGLSARSPR